MPVLRTHLFVKSGAEELGSYFLEQRGNGEQQQTGQDLMVVRYYMGGGRLNCDGQHKASRLQDDMNNTVAVCCSFTKVLSTLHQPTFSNVSKTCAVFDPAAEGWLLNKAAKAPRAREARMTFSSAPRVPTCGQDWEKPGDRRGCGCCTERRAREGSLEIPYAAASQHQHQLCCGGGSSGGDSDE